MTETCPLCTEPLSGDVVSSIHAYFSLCHLECHRRADKPFADALGRAIDEAAITGIEPVHRNREYWLRPTPAV